MYILRCVYIHIIEFIYTHKYLYTYTCYHLNWCVYKVLENESFLGFAY
jgi:hypothetical protein